MLLHIDTSFYIEKELIIDVLNPIRAFI